MRVTIKQIAQIAGVARSTVDKVLNDRPGVSDEVRDRIQQIAKDLGYEANIIGKALAFQKKQLIIAVVMPDIEFTAAAKVGFEKALKEVQAFGMQVEYYYTKDYDFAQQLATLKYLVAKKVAGIIIRPVENEKVQNAVREIVQNGIPVVTFNSDLKDSGRLCYVGQDPFKAGRVAGNIMAKLLAGRGQVAVLTGSLQLSALVLRTEGFRSFLQENYPQIEIVEVIETHEDRLVTFQKTMDLFQKYPDLAGLYETGGPVAEIGKAIKLKGLAGKIKTVWFDYYPENVELIKEGVVDFLIDQDPVAQGYLSVKVLFDYLFNHTLPEQEQLFTTIEIREKESFMI